MKTFATSLSLVLIAFAGLAHAQTQPGSNYASAAAGYGAPAMYLGCPVAGHVHHASTVFEGAQRGMAARVQAQAQYNLLSSLAALNMAQAERMRMENQQTRIENYRKEHCSAPRRQEGNTSAAEHAAAPAVGSVAWNAVLQKPQYAGFRKVAEQVAGKAAAGKAAPGDWERLQKATRLLASKLANEQPDAAALARQFVANLVAGGPAGTNRLAGNN
jgi:hypothetical protein